VHLRAFARIGALASVCVFLCAIDCATPTALTVHVYSAAPLDLVRFDTMASAFVLTAFDSFDLTTLPQHAAGYVGAVFDGRYLYLGPESGSVALRFDVRSPRGPLTSAGGSFL
jgi:hypothetical protein